MEKKMDIFFDTNTFLHYKNLDQIDFKSFFGDTTHKVLIPHILLKELEKVKSTGQIKKLKERADRAIKNIGKWNRSKKIKDGVEVKVLTKYPAKEFLKSHLLDDSVTDYVLLGFIMEYVIENKKTPVLFVTGDETLQITAETMELNFDCMLFPDNMKLPEQKDKNEIKIEELNKELLRYKENEPKLLLSLINSDSSTERSIKIRYFNFEEDLLEEMKIIKQKYPLGNYDAYLAIWESLDRPLVNTNFNQLRNPPSKEQIEHQNLKLETFYSEYEKYLYAKYKFQSFQYLGGMIELNIENTGNMPADDIDISITIPISFELFTEATIRSFLKNEPTPPGEKRNTTSIEQLYNIPLISEEEFESLQNNHEINGNTYSIHYDRLKQKTSNTLPALFFLCKSYDKAQTSECTYEINVGNIPKIQKGTFLIKVIKE